MAANRFRIMSEAPRVPPHCQPVPVSLFEGTLDELIAVHGEATPPAPSGFRVYFESNETGNWRNCVDPRCLQYSI